MLNLEQPSDGLLFFGILFRTDLFQEEGFAQKLEDLYGIMISHTPKYNPLAQYYAKEMGEASFLSRVFFVSTKAYPREFLLTTKLLSLDWERKWAVDGKRMVNVDIGLISPENFILATTKNYAHRVFLGQNIFADLTYQCIGGVFQTLPWTYPDFRDSLKVDFFTWCRSYLLTHNKIKTP